MGRLRVCNTRTPTQGARCWFHGPDSANAEILSSIKTVGLQTFSRVLRK